MNKNEDERIEPLSNDLKGAIDVVSKYLLDLGYQKVEKGAIVQTRKDQIDFLKYHGETLKEVERKTAKTIRDEVLRRADGGWNDIRAFADWIYIVFLKGEEND